MDESKKRLPLGGCAVSGYLFEAFQFLGSGFPGGEGRYERLSRASYERL